MDEKDVFGLNVFHGIKKIVEIDNDNIWQYNCLRRKIVYFQWKIQGEHEKLCDRRKYIFFCFEYIKFI